MILEYMDRLGNIHTNVCVCMYIYMYTCACMYVHIRAHISMSVLISISTFISVSLEKSISINRSICIRIYNYLSSTMYSGQNHGYCIKAMYYVYACYVL